MKLEVTQAMIDAFDNAPKGHPDSTRRGLEAALAVVPRGERTVSDARLRQIAEVGAYSPMFRDLATAILERT